MYTFRTMIVAAPAAAFARALVGAFPSAQGMFTRGLRPKGGGDTVTHFVNSGAVSEDLAALMPLTAWERTEAGWVQASHTDGQPEVIVAAADQAGATVTVEQVQALFAVCDVSEQAFDDAIDRLGLELFDSSEGGA